MAQQVLWNISREKSLQERGAMPKEEGDVVREWNAMHEEKFFRSWLREDLVGKKERRKKVDEKIREEVSKKGKREEEGKRDGEKEENETVSAERRCVGFISNVAFDIFLSRGGFGELWCFLGWPVGKS